MKVQIDQSGKVEKTNKDTILAFSNSIDFAVNIPAKVKRKLKLEFRRTGHIRVFTFRMFAAGIVLLIRDHLRKIDSIVIDQEYTGRELMIRDMIQEMLRKLRRKEPLIYFRRIGKKSGAHYVAYGTATHKRKADKILNYREIAQLVFTTKNRSGA